MIEPFPHILRTFHIPEMYTRHFMVVCLRPLTSFPNLISGWP